jgi:hypothetical protein
LDTAASTAPIEDGLPPIEDFRAARRARRKPLPWTLIIAITSVVITLLVAWLVDLSSHQHNAAQNGIKLEPVSRLTDNFVRNYVSNMLDYSPRSYRYSQIQAMAAMSPELMDKYWTQTNFPIPKEQLKPNSKRSAFLITNLTQHEADGIKNQRLVDVFGQLNNPDDNSTTAVHLKLTVELKPNGKMCVLDQKDVSSH